jgi:hypothetical protein
VQVLLPQSVMQGSEIMKNQNSRSKRLMPIRLNSDSHRDSGPRACLPSGRSSSDFLLYMNIESLIFV